ncbi:anthranilate synthase component I [Methanobacterium sp. ACI-7]|uniref:anthranilate synthase component I n=1 Tax=unclassified Methanobacterium TaxID=2627676 RepID=UPI0039C3E8C6
MNVFGDIKLKEPQIIELDFDRPFELFKNIYKNYESAFLLESMESDSGLARFSVIGFKPSAVLKACGNTLKIEKDGISKIIETENPFEEIKKLNFKSINKKGFTAGLVGYVSYEAAKYFENIKFNDSNYPDFEFGLFLDSIVFNRLENKCEYITFGENRIHEIIEVAKKSYNLGNIKFKSKNHHYSKEEYEKMVLKAKESIKAGEIFQSVISNAREYEIEGDKLSIYKTLRETNPSPYMYHLKLKTHEIIGSSPEMLVRVEDGEVETYPIAGTRHRGSNNEEDEKLAIELLEDEKELAEHLMLVDLARNDIGKVSEFDSVKVPEYMGIKKFSHVQHIVSRVTGTLRKDMTSVDAFSSVFPAGTLSGAPKIRAIEIINKLEGISRGPYGGALGYFSLDGNADFAITIRTLICNGNYAKIQAGAGIVHDSIPEKEYYECENKAMAIVNALEIASRRKISDFSGNQNEDFESSKNFNMENEL